MNASVEWEDWGGVGGGPVFDEAVTFTPKESSTTNSWPKSGSIPSGKAKCASGASVDAVAVSPHRLLE